MGQPGPGVCRGQSGVWWGGGGQLGHGGHLLAGTGALWIGEEGKPQKIIEKDGSEKGPPFHFSFYSGWTQREQQFQLLILGGDGLLPVAWPNPSCE